MHAPSQRKKNNAFLSFVVSCGEARFPRAIAWAFFVWSEVSQRRHLERVDVSRPAPAHRRGRRPPMGGGERGDAQRSEPGALWV